MIRLRVLGPVELLAADGREPKAVLAHPTRLALFIYLAAGSRGFHQRDALLRLFWPELDDVRAREELAAALNVIRQTFGPQAIATGSVEEIGIKAGFCSCDARTFREQAEAGRYREALDLYRGEFLEGFVPGLGARFDAWIEKERADLRSRAARAARAFADARAKVRDFPMAVAYARRAIELSTGDEAAVRELLEMLDRLGDRAGVLLTYDAYSRRLADEHGTEPAAETKALIDRVRSRSSSRGGEGSTPGRSRAVTPDRSTTPSGSRPVVQVNGWHTVRELGRGDLSTVYLARDVRLDRLVALKAMRPELTRSLGVDRFLREIQSTAQLAHPRIVPLIDCGTRDGVLYLVAPYVAGESLRTRLAREGALPVGDAVRIAREVATALDHAHHRGIVHGDITPDNILLADGHALVADFGVAQAVLSSEGASGPEVTGPRPALVATPYTTPDAFGGRAVSPAADLYALGRVLLEMLAGALPHNGDSPDGQLRRRADVPSALRRLVADCHARQPERRPPSAAEIIRRLDGGPRASTPPRSATPMTSITPPSQRGVETIHKALDVVKSSIRAAVHTVGTRSGLAVGAVAIGATVFFSATRGGSHVTPAPTGPVRRLTIVLPDTAPIALRGASTLGVPRRALALAPDGSTLAYVASVGSTTMLYTRRMEDAAFRAIPGTSGAFAPFFSPDGKWIAYFAGTRLFRVDAVAGSRPELLAEVVDPQSGVWLPPPDGRIVVASSGKPLSIVPPDGGTNRPLAGLATSGLGARSVGRKWLLTSIDRSLAFLTVADTLHGFALTNKGDLAAWPPSSPSAVVHGLDPVLVSGTLMLFVESGSDGVMMALPFDTARMVATGPAVQVANGIRVDAGGVGVAQYAAADEGTMAFVAGHNEMMSALVVRDRSAGARVDTLPFPRSDVASIDLARDGHAALASVARPGMAPRLAIFDITRAAVTMLSDTIASAIWTPDSRAILASRPAGADRFVTVRLSPSGQVEDTVLRDGPVLSTDDRLRVFLIGTKNGDRLVWRDSSAHPSVRLNERAGTTASIAPRGEWVALSVRVAGRSEIFVARASDPEERYRVTTEGGEEPIWNEREDEIVYRNGTSVWAVPVSTRDGFHFAQPRQLFDGPFQNVGGYSHGVMPDGRRHLLLTGASDPIAHRIEVVTGWNSELRRLSRD